MFSVDVVCCYSLQSSLERREERTCGACDNKRVLREIINKSFFYLKHTKNMRCIIQCTLYINDLGQKDVSNFNKIGIKYNKFKSYYVFHKRFIISIL